jgi:phosphoglycerol transferase MdoB-like AlkP superfamily enzyme
VALRHLVPFVRPLLIIAAHFARFFLARLAVLFIYRQDFTSLSVGDILWAFVRGLRFDGAIIFLVIGMPVLLLMLPFPWAQREPWQGIWGWCCYAAFILFFLVVAIDTLYFGYVHRHGGLDARRETNALLDASRAVARTGVGERLLPILGIFAASAAVFFGWHWLMRGDQPPVTDLRVRIVVTLLAFGLMYAGAHATFTKRTKSVHVFDGVPHAAAVLALNGPFSILQSLDYAKPVKRDFYPWPEAVAVAQKTLFAREETASPDPAYPLLRSRPAPQAQKPNVVVIMLESWDAYYVDAHRREMGLPPLGITPHYDAISREGVLLSRFYATGQKSMDGMSALLAGFPTLPGIPYLGRGMEQGSLPFLGHLAKQEGYDTLFIQASHRHVYGVDAISALAGFTTYLAAEDIPPAQPQVSRSVLGGAAWDHEMFAEANRRLAAARRPFCAFLYTDTTHSPYAWPGKEWEKIPLDGRDARYKTSLGYADEALGRYFMGAKAAGYFDSTIFILAADHITGIGGATLGDPATLHHIVGLVLAPGLKPGVDRRIGSQLDVIPTIADLAGWSAPYSAVGRSLFAEVSPTEGAFCVEGEVIVRIEEGGCMVHNFSSRTTKKYREDADFDGMERRLLSIYQVAATLLRTNRLYPSRVGADALVGQAPLSARRP